MIEFQILLCFGNIMFLEHNAVVPIAGVIDYYRREKNIVIDGRSSDSLLYSILSPFELPSHSEYLSRAMGKIWKFNNSSDIRNL